MTYDREPIDDYDARVQDYWYHENRRLDRVDERESLARDLEFERTLSSEARLARHGVPPDPSDDWVDEEQYERRPFESADPDRVANWIEIFADSNDEFSTPGRFARYRRWALEAIDESLPPSADKEAVFAEVAGIRALDPATRARLSALAASIRDGGAADEPEPTATESTDTGATAQDPSVFSALLGSMGRPWWMTPSLADRLVVTGLETLAQWCLQLWFPEDRFDQYKEWLTSDIERSSFTPTMKAELREHVAALEHGDPTNFATVNRLARRVRELDETAD